MAALWKLTLLPHVIGCVRLGGGIKVSQPDLCQAALLSRILTADWSKIDSNRARSASGTRAQRPAAANTFGVKRCLLLRYASLS